MPLIVNQAYASAILVIHPNFNGPMAKLADAVALRATLEISAGASPVRATNVSGVEKSYFLL